MNRRNFLFTVLGIPAIVKAVKSFNKPTNWRITRNGHEIKFWRDGEPVDQKDSPFHYYTNWDTGKSEIRIE